MDVMEAFRTEKILMNSFRANLKASFAACPRFRPVLISAVVAASAIALTSGGASASVVFSDSTYNPADYSAAFDSVVSSTPLTDSTFTAGYHEGLYFNIDTNGPSGGNGILNGVLNTTFVYNPAVEGAISSISASALKTFYVLNTDPTAGSVTFSNNFRPLIEQDGNFYAAAIPGPNVGPVPGGQGQNVGPTLLSNSDLTLNDFFLIDTTTGTITGSHGSLNFDGDPLTFGLVQLLGTAGTQVNAVTTYQNLTFGISAVPLPASAPLFAAALVGLGALGIGRKRHRASATH